VLRKNFRGASHWKKRSTARGDHFSRIGRFTAEDIKRVSESLEFFPGRIERDDWVGGAKEAYQKKYGRTLD